jgi:predicted phosphodiesterase
MIGVVSDIHGNIAALEAVVEAARGAGCSRFISLGDIVGYYPRIGECVDLLREVGATNIMGNHDYYLVSGTDCPRSRLVAELGAYQRQFINDEQIAWLAESKREVIEGANVFVHGGPRDPQDQYLYRVSEMDIPPGAKRLFSGHTHVQTLFAFPHAEYCNPGSVGQPRDGDPRAAFATFDGSEIVLHRVPYDIDRMASDMKAAGFPAKYYENLYIGAQIGGRIDKVTRIESGSEHE